MSKSGWQFTFSIQGEGVPPDQPPIRVVVEGEIGNKSLNSWEEDAVVYYENEAEAIRIAQEAVRDLFVGPTGAIPLQYIVWIETVELHQDHYVGLNRVDLGVWI